MQYHSLATLVLERVQEFDSRRVFVHKRGNQWEDVSWRTFGKDIIAAAKGLATLGFKEGDRLAILAENGPAWPTIDLACLYLGGVDVPLYLTSHPKDLTYILNDSGATVLAVDGDDQRAKLTTIAGEIPGVRHIVQLDAEAAPTVNQFAGIPSLTLLELIAKGNSSIESAHHVKEPDLATIIYTSGTTGLPKGVMLSHSNILANVVDALQVLPITSTDQTMSFLPLSHGFERTAGLYTILAAGACIAYGGGTVTLTKDLADIRPTLFCCVPRVLELVYRRVLTEKENAAAPKKFLLELAISKAKTVGQALTSNPTGTGTVRFPLNLLHLALYILVFRKLRVILGGRTRFLISGGAPLNSDICYFFFGAGMTVYQGYGLTEAGPVVSCNIPTQSRVGSVGPALPQVSVRTDNDGEICVRGPNVMRGYFNKPKETAQVLDADGWLHTGDVGEIDQNGFITITDRKKDLIITSEGENIAPQAIEGLFKKSPLIEEACVIGDKRPYLTALLVPNRTFVESAASRMAVIGDWPNILGHAKIRTLFKTCTDDVNKQMPLYSRVRRFRVLELPFSSEEGEVTPTMKVRRRTVAETRSAEIDAMYPKRTRV